MSVTFATIVRPEATERPGTVVGLVVAWCDVIAGYFVRRSAIATLHELDDRALRDIGIVRSQIEPAVHGFIGLTDRARMS